MEEETRWEALEREADRYRCLPLAQQHGKDTPFVRDCCDVDRMPSDKIYGCGMVVHPNNPHYPLRFRHGKRCQVANAANKKIQLQIKCTAAICNAEKAVSATAELFTIEEDVRGAVVEGAEATYEAEQTEAEQAENMIAEKEQIDNMLIMQGDRASRRLCVLLCLVIPMLWLLIGACGCTASVAGNWKASI